MGLIRLLAHFRGMRFNLHPLINQHPDRLPHLGYRRIWYLAGQPMAATCALIYTRLLINISGYGVLTLLLNVLGQLGGPTVPPVPFPLAPPASQ